VPEIRPFRALRFVSASVGDLADVVAPPYDVIDPDEAAALAARHPANVVRLDLPAVVDGDEPDDRYRRAARTLAEWRSGGILHKDPHPSVYLYQQDYRVPGTSVTRSQRGFFARLRLEPLAPGGGVRPHERTMSAPKEDRYKLLRATGVNTSPVVALVDDATEVDRRLAEFARRAPDADLTDADGVRHRLWAVPADGEDAEAVAALLAAAGRAPVTIADGHHRYETALRYRDERRMSRSCEEDPAFDYLLTLFLPTGPAPLTVLPTHRIVRDLDEATAGGLVEALQATFAVEPVASAEALCQRFEAAALEPGGQGRFGLWTRSGGASLTARRPAFSSSLASADPAVRELDVTLLGVTLDRVLGLGPEAVAAGAVAYTKSASDAIDRVAAGTDGASAAFLLEPTPVAAIMAVAAAGAVMPQKSTYFYPKALTGLVINPHEW
jgi:uncharacterized protein (DUF1015 family)